ncbi:hypothetical protein [Actinacidiphila rubida]|uniref:hypothetical protein n=1 Tax=Actinacidiphila rubida TaxID=310780 RepID=UPI000849A21A|nr:hypothetical protein [Actinacidiphila rubida]
MRALVGEPGLARLDLHALAPPATGPLLQEALGGPGARAALSHATAHHAPAAHHPVEAGVTAGDA